MRIKQRCVRLADIHHESLVTTIWRDSGNMGNLDGELGADLHYDYLSETPILNFSHPTIQQTMKRLNLYSKSEEEKIRSIYNFVRDNVEFGFNESDDLPASKVLEDKYGQCNTKTSLLMALLRAVGISCRVHFFTIDKKIQRGILTGLHYRLCPAELVHSWTEVLYRDKWINLEGVILDEKYLQSLKEKFGNSGHFEGYGVAVDIFSNASTEWTGDDTYIQSRLIKRDLGLFDSPDDFYRQSSTNLKGLVKVLFNHHIRSEMNRKVSEIREGDE